MARGVVDAGVDAAVGAPAPFLDRADAGRRLAQRLVERPWRNPAVVGLARGGVPVAAVVADALGAPLDVAVARKIDAPGRPEFGVGAVTADGPVWYDAGKLAEYDLDVAELTAESGRARAEARRRLAGYREWLAPVPLAGRDVVLVDDGLATGVTARAALRELRAAGPRTLVLAVPACARRSREALRRDAAADDVVCVTAPAPFGSVSRWYRDFHQVDDREVRAALSTARTVT